MIAQEAWDEILDIEQAWQCLEEFFDLYMRFYEAEDAGDVRWQREISRSIETALAKWRALFPAREDGADFAYTLKLEALRAVREPVTP